MKKFFQNHLSIVKYFLILTSEFIDKSSLPDFKQHETIDLKTTTPNEIFLETTQIPYDSINQLEISTLEKECEFKVTINQKKEVANINVDTINILDTTEIITGEKETVYTPLTKPITRQAFIDITDTQPVSKVFEVKPEDSTSELITPNVVTCTVKPSQEIVHGVVIFDNIGHDKEEIFEGEFRSITLLFNYFINIIQSYMICSFCSAYKNDLIVSHCTEGLCYMYI